MQQLVSALNSRESMLFHIITSQPFQRWGYFRGPATCKCGTDPDIGAPPPCPQLYNTKGQQYTKHWLNVIWTWIGVHRDSRRPRKPPHWVTSIRMSVTPSDSVCCFNGDIKDAVFEFKTAVMLLFCKIHSSGCIYFPQVIGINVCSSKFSSILAYFRDEV